MHPSTADPVSQILSSIRLRSLILERSIFTAPWGFHLPFSRDGSPTSMPPSPPIFPPIPPIGGNLFAVLEGQAYLQVDAAPPTPPVLLTPGSFALLPRAISHSLRDSLSTPTPNLLALVPPPPLSPHLRPPPLRLGASTGPRTVILIGILHFESPLASRVLSSLPPLIHVDGKGTAVPWLSTLLAALEHESNSPIPGSPSITSHLTHALFDHAIRSHLLSRPKPDSPTPPSPLNALSDPDIARALAVLHDQPAKAWTVQLLANHVAMSRSTFAERFAALVGEPPLRYLTAYRLGKAAELLASPHLQVKEIATLVGYESLAAFSNAFKRHHGTSPAAYRKTVTPRTSDPAKSAPHSPQPLPQSA